MSLIDDSLVVQKALEYAQLCQLSKAKWVWNDANKEWLLNDSQYSETWKSLQAKYKVLNVWDDTHETGYFGILFYNSSEGRAVLVNKGSDGINDAAADISIAAGNVPAEQFRSMVEFITYCQNAYGEYLSVFDVTGHSLGGCLAQMAKATYPSDVLDVYTYNAPGAQYLAQSFTVEAPSATPGKVIVTDGHFSYEWDTYVWDNYHSFFTNRIDLDSSHVFNISGLVGPSLIANHDQDIGGEVFLDSASHFIDSLIKSIDKGTYYIDPRGPVNAIIGNSRDERILANYNSGKYSIYSPRRVTLVGGYGDDRLWGGDGNDWLYGDLHAELSDEDKRRTGNGSGRPGNDTLIGRLGNDYLNGGEGDDILYGGAGQDIADRNVIHAPVPRRCVTGEQDLELMAGRARGVRQGDAVVVARAVDDLVAGDVGFDVGDSGDPARVLHVVPQRASGPVTRRIARGRVDFVGGSHLGNGDKLRTGMQRVELADGTIHHDMLAVDDFLGPCSAGLAENADRAAVHHAFQTVQDFLAGMVRVDVADARTPAGAGRTHGEEYFVGPAGTTTKDGEVLAAVDNDLVAREAGMHVADADRGPIDHASDRRQTFVNLCAGPAGRMPGQFDHRSVGQQACRLVARRGRIELAPGQCVNGARGVIDGFRDEGGFAGPAGRRRQHRQTNERCTQKRSAGHGFLSAKNMEVRFERSRTPILRLQNPAG